jgi:hypothetical protein
MTTTTLARRCLVGLSLLVLAGAAAGQARLWDKAGPCDRDCLKGVVDKYVEAMVKHDAKAAPFAVSVKFTENAEAFPIGQGGLWTSATGASKTYRIYVPDPVSRQVGFMGLIQTGEMQNQLALRLKVEDGKITEAEHYVARNLNANVLGNLQAPRPGLLATLPANKRIPRELMLIIAASYYDAITNSNADLTLFATDCERHENGMITAGGSGPGFNGQPRPSCTDNMNSHALSYITGIDLRRVWIADPVTGLVFAYSQFRHEFKTKDIQVVDKDGGVSTRQMNYEPFDFPSAHITKIEDYKVHEQEAMGYRLPYMSSNGWNRFLR